MICKECGAYNPNHAAYCKVCAVRLKELDSPVASVSREREIPAWEKLAPTPREQIAPSPSPAPRERKAPEPWNREAPAPWESAAPSQSRTPRYSSRSEESFPAPRPIAEPDCAEPEVVAEYEYDSEEETTMPETLAEQVFVPTEEEQVFPEKPVRMRHSRSFAPVADVEKEPVPVAKEPNPQPIQEPDEDEDQTPPPSFRRRSRAITPAIPVPVAPKEDDFEEDEDAMDEQSDADDSAFASSKMGSAPFEDEDSFATDESDDDYEYEYEPTTPRRKQKEGGNKLFWILLTILVALVTAVGTINGYSYFSGKELPAWLKWVQFQTWFASEPAPTPTPAPVVEEPPTIVDSNDEQGMPCKMITVFLNPGDTVNIEFPNLDGHVESNTNEAETARFLSINVPLGNYYPGEPLDSPDYTVTPTLFIETATGERRDYVLDSFTLPPFPSVSLELIEPDVNEGEGGLEATEGNVIYLKGVVDDPEVTVYANDQRLTTYEGGAFMGDYTLTQEDGTEKITIRAEKKNMVTATLDIDVAAFVFVPEPMVLSVEKNIENQRAGSSGKVTLTGKTLPGAQIEATSSTLDAPCGSAIVDEAGNYSFTVTFNQKYYGFANITIQSTLEGYEEGTVTCLVYNPPPDRGSFTSAHKGDYFELDKDVTLEEMKTKPNAPSVYRIKATIKSVDQVDEFQVMTVQTTGTTQATFYVINLLGWDATKRMDKTFSFYGQLNGFYPGTEDQDLCLVALSYA